MKGGQAQGPLVKSVHIPSLSEGIQANPGLLRQKVAYFHLHFIIKHSISLSFYKPKDFVVSLLLSKTGVVFFVIFINFSTPETHFGGNNRPEIMFHMISAFPSAWKITHKH